MSQRRSGPGHGPGGGGGGNPGGNAGARGAILLAVALILGIVLLQQFDSGIDTGAQVSTDTSVASDETTTTRRVGLTTAPSITSTTIGVRPKGEVRVLVANGSGLRGLAGNTSNALKGLGYATLSPVDATGQVDKTSVQFADGWEAEAREVAAALNQPATVVVRATSPPVAAADLGDAKVVVVLGADLATTTTAPGATTTSTTIRR